MKKILLQLVITGGFFYFSHGHSYAQGCVAIRQFSGIGQTLNQGELFRKGDWNFNTNYRFFRSFRHFKGTHEEPDRVSNNTEVINWSHSLDLNISYAFSDQIYGILSLPFVYNERSSLYEHGRANRHKSYSQGIADMRIGAGYWLFSGEKASKGNMAIGASLKLPTGDYNAQSTFYHVGPGGSPEVRPVDQSIQPGDGGFGWIIDSQGLRFFRNGFVFYYDGFYLINPRETNGTRTFRETLNPILSNESIMAVPDQFAFRAGIFKSLFIHGLGLSLGGRIEGVPVRDLFGGNDGFRRPGYVVSVEPGMSYMVGNFNFNLNIPVALQRNRTRSVTDIKATTPDNFRHGDAAFADYLINIGLSWRIAKKETALFNEF
jgi:hypothetical protein